MISKRKLLEHSGHYPDATSSLQTWLEIAERAEWRSLTEVRATFRDADMLGKVAIFNIKGNRYRLVVRLEFEHRRIFIKEFLTHAEYDKENWKKWL